MDGVERERKRERYWERERISYGRRIVRDLREKEMALEKGKGKENEKGVSWWETAAEMGRKNDLGVQT